jgi:hypothetical protein
MDIALIRGERCVLSGTPGTAREKCFRDRLQELVEYNEKHGDTLVPTHYTENPSLTIWVKTQRYQYKKYCNNEQPCYLNDIGFCWDGNAVSAQWTDSLKQLVEYKEKHGNTFVPTNHPENPPLTKWVMLQGHHYKKYCNNEQPCRMNEERVQLLNDLGFCWDGTAACSQWMIGYKSSWSIKRSMVTHWFQHTIQRILVSQSGYCKNEQPCCMNEERVQLLNDIGFFWGGTAARICNVNITRNTVTMNSLAV